MIQNLPPPELSRAAADLWRGRQQSAARRVARGEWTVDQATARLRPWLAIACLAGADLPELEHGLADQRVRAIDGGPGPSESLLRTLEAEAICPRPQWAPVLAHARDSALNAGLPAASTLVALCRALDVLIPYLPAPNSHPAASRPTGGPLPGREIHHAASRPTGGMEPSEAATLARSGSSAASGQHESPAS